MSLLSKIFKKSNTHATYVEKRFNGYIVRIVSKEIFLSKELIDTIACIAYDGFLSYKSIEGIVADVILYTNLSHTVDIENIDYGMVVTIVPVEEPEK